MQSQADEGEARSLQWRIMMLEIRSRAVLLSLFAIAIMGPSENCSGEDSNARSQVACDVDSDCEFVNDGCCGCFQGGKRRAINYASVPLYNKSQDAECAETFCIQVISNDLSCASDAKPVCEEGKCQVR